MQWSAHIYRHLVMLSMRANGGSNSDINIWHSGKECPFKKIDLQYIIKLILRSHVNVMLIQTEDNSAVWPTTCSDNQMFSKGIYRWPMDSPKIDCWSRLLESVNRSVKTLNKGTRRSASVASVLGIPRIPHRGSVMLIMYTFTLFSQALAMYASRYVSQILDLSLNDYSDAIQRHGSYMTPWISLKVGPSDGLDHGGIKKLPEQTMTIPQTYSEKCISMESTCQLEWRWKCSFKMSSNNV